MAKGYFLIWNEEVPEIAGLGCIGVSLLANGAGSLDFEEKIWVCERRYEQD